MNKITPGIGVGEVNFSGGVEPIVAAGYLEDVAGFDEIMGWRTFRKDNQLECYVKDDAVVCIACFENCVIGDFSLIGKKLPELLRVLGQPDEVGETVWVSEETQQIPYEYFSPGLQIWLESGSVCSVFCNTVY